jgi:hypothetical protein
MRESLLQTTWDSWAVEANALIVLRLNKTKRNIAAQKAVRLAAPVQLPGYFCRVSEVLLHLASRDSADSTADAVGITKKCRISRLAMRLIDVPVLTLPDRKFSKSIAFAESLELPK